MTRFHSVGLCFSALMVSLSTLGLTCVSPRSLAVNSRPPGGYAPVAASTDTIDSTDLDTGVVESESPVPIVEGEGGDFAYQIWQDAQVSDYYLFIWKNESAPLPEVVNTPITESLEEPIVSYNFDSAAEAVNFFTCRYAREQINACLMVMSSVSYDVPEACAFPWVACTEP